MRTTPMVKRGRAGVFARLVLAAFVAALVIPESSVAAAPAPPRAAAPFDFNGDGWRDLAIGAPGEVVANRDGVFLHEAGQVHVLFGTRDGVSRRDVLVNADRGSGFANDPMAGAAFGSTITSADFDADGRAELVAGAPDESFGTSTGVVRVFRWRSGQFVLNASLYDVGALVNPDATDGQREHVGESLAAGDFDDDGYADLAYGVPDATVNAEEHAGRVRVYYGGPRGLQGPQPRSQTWDQNSFGVIPVSGVAGAQSGDRFGASLAAMDVDGDNVSDLVVGIPGASASEGAIRVIYGTRAEGLTADRTQQISLASPGIKGEPQTYFWGEEFNGDRFGAGVVTADFDADGFGDVAVGIPNKRVLDGGSNMTPHGAVSVIYGSRQGLSQRDHYLTEDTPGVPGRARRDWEFGGALAAKDFNGDGRDDLAVAAPGSAHHDRDRTSGSVTVVYGGGQGLRARTAQRITQATPGIPGRAERGDMFGRALMATKALGRGRWDLLVGVPGEDIGSAGDAGAVTLIAGGEGHLRTRMSRRFTENSRGLRDVSEPADRFGAVGPVRRTTGDKGETQ